MTEQVDVKKLAGWAGLQARDKWFLTPYGKTAQEPYPDFPNDLNACEEHLLPPILAKGYEIKMEMYPIPVDQLNNRVGIFNLSGTEFAGWGNKLATAFCKAVEQLVDAGI